MLDELPVYRVLDNGFAGQGRCHMQTAVSISGKKSETRALRYILDAWEDALEDGLQSDQLANAALFAALTDLVGAYGETAVVKLTDGLAKRLESGEFTLHRTLQ